MQNIAGKSTVIFDLDGLLIDSEPFWQKAREAFFQKYNLRDSPALKNLTHGAGIIDNITLYKKRLGLTGDTDRLVSEYRGFVYQFAFEDQALSLMPGAKHLLHCLSENSYQLAIATGGHPTDKIDEILEKLEIAEYFPTRISSDMVEKGKPDPAVYLKTAEVLHVQPSDCVVLEDSVNGVLSGKAAGMTVIGVNSESTYQKELLKAGADMVVDRLDDLIPVFSGGCCGKCDC